MAEKNIKKQLELLRLLLHEGKSTDNKTLAGRLGMSDSTFQKTATQVNELIHQFQYEKMPALQAIPSIIETIQQNPYEIDNLDFYNLFSHSGVSTERFLKDAIILHAVSQLQPATAIQVEQQCFTYSDRFNVQFQEKYVVRTLKKLAQLGYVQVESAFKGKKKITLYSFVSNNVIRLFAKELLAFLHHARHTAMLPSITFSIERKINLLLNKPTEHTLYPYYYSGRLLDDAIALELVQIINDSNNCSFYYSPVKLQKKYISNYDKNLEKQTVTPLKLVFEVTNNRWYLLAEKEANLHIYRLDHIYQLQQLNKTNQTSTSLQSIDNSWNSSTQQLEHVVVRFYQENTNFIEKRVLAQGGHGQITNYFDDGFQWEIQVNGTTEITPWLRSFGSSAEILLPLSLRQQFKKEWLEMERRYETSI